MEQTRASIDRLKATRAELEATFAEIDQIEAVVQRVKETYNQVASSVDEMDKAVAASRSGSSSPAAGGASSFPLFFLVTRWFHKKEIGDAHSFRLNSHPPAPAATSDQRLCNLISLHPNL